MRLICTCLLLLPVAAQAIDATDNAEPTRHIAWATVSVEPDGLPSRIEVHEAGSYPEGFVSRLQQRIAMTQFEPVVVDGEARSFSTPLKILLSVQPDANGVQVGIVDMAPAIREVKRFRPYYPQQEAQLGREGAVTLACTLDAAGQCGRIEVVERRGPQQLVRSATEAMRRDVFEVPRIEGVPVDGVLTRSYGFYMRPENAPELPPSERPLRQRIDHSALHWFRIRHPGRL